MKSYNKSLFNLIEIFRRGNMKNATPINVKAHCEQKHHHDFYCDSEKPFISIFKVNHNRH